MLTKSDLSQIRQVIREEVEVESKTSQEEIQGEIKLARIEIQKDIKANGSRIKTLEIIITKTQKDIKSIITFFDKEYLSLRKKVERLEENLHLPPLFYKQKRER